MAVAIMVSTFGCNNGLILAGARAYYAMARDGLFFRRVGELNKNHVPAWGLIIQGIWAGILVLPHHNPILVAKTLASLPCAAVRAKRPVCEVDLVRADFEHVRGDATAPVEHAGRGATHADAGHAHRAAGVRAAPDRNHVRVA